MAGQPKNHQILAVRPFSRPSFSHFSATPRNGCRPCRRPFSAIFGSGPFPRSHSVAGQPSLKPFPENEAFSGTKKEPKPKLLSPDIFWWGGGLPREGVGAKKFGMSLETQGIKLFWRDIPGFCRDIPEAPEKFEKKMFGFNFWPLPFGETQLFAENR